MYFDRVVGILKDNIILQRYLENQGLSYGNMYFDRVFGIFKDNVILQ